MMGMYKYRGSLFSILYSLFSVISWAPLSAFAKALITGDPSYYPLNSKSKKLRTALLGDLSFILT